MVVTRFAPSPTGSLHIGGIRTALYAYALAKKHRGRFILRIEDTDQERSTEESILEIIAMLKAYGIEPDIFPDEAQIEERRQESFYHQDWLLHADEIELIKDEDYADKYIQTLRVPLYQKYALYLLKNKFAYLCFCSKDRLSELRKEQQANHEKPGYDGCCRECGYQEAMNRVRAGEEYVVRLNVQEYIRVKGTSKVVHDDRLLGQLEFNLNEVDDQVLIKSNGVPTYHLAVVVDDHLMKITHPIRASEWISSTPKQVMIYDMFGWTMPQFTHPTAILDPKGGKLSKRKGSVAAKEFLELGYLPATVLNFMMLLGWAPGNDQEIINLDQFVKMFTLEGLNKSNPIFDRTKLEWLNGVYIREKMTPAAYLATFKEFVSPEFAADKSIPLVAPLVRERIRIFSEVPELTNYFFREEIDIGGDLLVKQSGEIHLAQDMLGETIAVLEKLDGWSVDILETCLKESGQDNGWSNKKFFMTIRVAVSGRKTTPPLFDTLFALGKDKTLNRLRKARSIVDN